LILKHPHFSEEERILGMQIVILTDALAEEVQEDWNKKFWFLKKLFVDRFDKSMRITSSGYRLPNKKTYAFKILRMVYLLSVESCSFGSVVSQAVH